MEAESKASAQCHELEEQILQLRAKLKEVKNLAKTVESKAPAAASDSNLKRERDQLMVSERVGKARDGADSPYSTGHSPLSSMRYRIQEQDSSHMFAQCVFWSLL